MLDYTRLRQWSEEVARDPRSLAFLPLARAYRESGREAAALRLCIRGLEHHPEHVEAHHFLGELYRAAGELDKAFDEWDIVLRLDPSHGDARREIGLLCAERGDWDGARRHLRQSAVGSSADPRVAEALATLPGEPPSAAAPVGRTPAGAASASSTLIRSLQAPIERFVVAARPHVLLLINSQGKLLGQHGFPETLDPVAVASLAAGIHASSRALAGMLGQDGFDHLCQRGSRGQIFIGPFATPSEELILIAVLRAESVLGLARISFAAFVREVGALAEWQASRPAATAEKFEDELEAGWVELFAPSARAVEARRGQRGAVPGAPGGAAPR